MIMDTTELPLATEMMEGQASAMAREGLSPEKYAARWAHTIFCFSLDEYRYRDPQVHRWIHALGDILFGRPGAPSLEDLRERFLTTEERDTIRKEQEEEEL